MFENTVPNGVVQEKLCAQSRFQNVMRSFFACVYHEEYPLKVHFTREGWNGRMKSCCGVGASLNEQEITMWEQEHRKLLEKIAPEEFDVLHYAAIAELKLKSGE